MLFIDTNSLDLWTMLISSIATHPDPGNRVGAFCNSIELSSTVAL